MTTRPPAPPDDATLWPRLERGAAGLADPAAAAELEWIETNGLGGYALQGVGRPLRRCYSGLLVAAVRPPVFRMVLLARFEEHLVRDGRCYRLWADRRGGRESADAPPVVSPVSFGRYPFPRFTWDVAGCRLRRTVVVPADRNSVLVRYWLTTAPGAVTLVLDPLLAFRDHHETRRAGGALPPLEVAVGEGVLTLRATDTPAAPALRLLHAGARYLAAPGWARGYRHDVETERGLPDVDDYMTPGLLLVRLEPGQGFDIIATTEETTESADRLEDAERARRRDRLRPAAAEPEWVRRLHLAAEQFLVRRGAHLRSIVAGYPWFTDWGRDSMIALPGLCLATGRVEEGGAILATFAAHARGGLLPNHFPDDGDEPHYNTVDASLWFFQALRQYRAAGGSAERLRFELFPVAREIVRAYREGTEFGIGSDSDGLVRWDAPGQALTWMDARIDDRAFTPRRGFPVEIQALWHAALLELAALERLFGDATAAAAAEALAAKVQVAFEARFWNEATGTLHDVLDLNGRPDPAVRPNAIFAVSLPGARLKPARARSVVAVAQRDLLTPVGLRSLAPGHPDYHGIFVGDRPTRDAAYHQGTVWGWLLGPYAEALWRTTPDRALARATVLDLLERAAEHLDADGLGTFAEVFDGDPPHHPRGCLAQAWSVAELLRVRALVLSEAS